MTARQRARKAPPLAALAVLHPFPSALNGLLVLVVAVVAGGTWWTAASLGTGMLCLHLAIGGLNDLVDAPADALFKPHKPIPAGIVSHRAALLMTGMAAGIGLLISWGHGPVSLLLGVGVLGAGLAYDLFLKPTPLGSIPYAVAFTILPVYAWHGVTGGLPPEAGLVLSVAALAGPTLQLANGLVDLEADQAAGLRGPAVFLGRRRALIVLIVLEAVVHGLAWLTLARWGTVTPVATVAVAAGSISAGAGLWLTAGQPSQREAGWRLQAVGLVLLASGWLLAATEA